MLILPRSAQHQNLQRQQRVVGEHVLADAAYFKLNYSCYFRSELRPILSVTRQLFIMSELSLGCFPSTKGTLYSCD